MMNLQFEHKKLSLMSQKKEELVKHIMYLEHNVNALQQTIDTQAENFPLLEKKAIDEHADKTIKRMETFLEAYIQDSVDRPYGYEMGFKDAIAVVKEFSGSSHGKVGG